MVDFAKYRQSRPPMPAVAVPAVAVPAVAVPEVALSIEERLRATVNGELTSVEFAPGGPGDLWYREGAEIPLFGWTAKHIEVGREDGWLYVDTDEGMRYIVPEDRDVTIEQGLVAELEAVHEHARDAHADHHPAEAGISQSDNGHGEQPRVGSPGDHGRSGAAGTLPADDPHDPADHADDLAAAIAKGIEDAADEADAPLEEFPADEPQFLYIAGTAGTGKSYLARQRAEHYADAILTATTGIAAINLGGTTINSILRYHDFDDLRKNYELGIIGSTLKTLTRSGYFRLIVDEVSMMDGRQLPILCLAIDDVNQWLEANEQPRRFGLTLVGDFAQLPPVNAPFVFEPANNPAWARFEPHTTLLTEPRRQVDPDFVHALQAVRRGDKQYAQAYFSRFITPYEHPKFVGTTILAKNDEVDRYNRVRMLELPDPSYWYEPIRVGEQSTEWKNIPDQLEMKKGALVMILSNKRQRIPGEPPETWPMLYANGDLAHFEDYVDTKAVEYDETTKSVRTIPTPQSAKALVRLLRNNDLVIVDRVVRERKKATGHKGVKAARDSKEGAIDYLPLRVAYATTVHKSQGLSLDNVQVMMHSQFWTQPGMAYVALSRARTPGGLRIVCTPQQFASRVNANPKIQRWL